MTTFTPGEAASLFMGTTTIPQTMAAYAKFSDSYPEAATILATARDNRMDAIRGQHNAVQQAAAQATLASMRLPKVSSPSSLTTAIKLTGYTDVTRLATITNPTPIKEDAPTIPPPVIVPPVRPTTGYEDTVPYVPASKRSIALPEPAKPVISAAPVVVFVAPVIATDEVATIGDAELDTFFAPARARGIKFNVTAWQFWSAEERDRNAVKFFNDVGGEEKLNEAVRTRLISPIHAGECLVIVQRKRHERGVKAAQTRAARKE